MRRRWRPSLVGYLYAILGFLFDDRQGVPTRLVPSDEHVWHVAVVMSSFSPTSVIGKLKVKRSRIATRTNWRVTVPRAFQASSGYEYNTTCSVEMSSIYRWSNTVVP